MLMLNPDGYFMNRNLGLVLWPVAITTYPAVFIYELIHLNLGLHFYRHYVPLCTPHHSHVIIICDIKYIFN